MKEKMENQMNNIKISMLTIMLILCALSGVQACIVYTAPDGVRMSSLQMGRFCEIEQYIQTSAEMCEFIEQSGIENNSAFLLEIYAAGESETNIAGCFGHNPVMPSKGLTGTSRCLFMFAGIFGTLAAFGKKRYEHAKRLFDIIVAAVALIILSPLILLCMLIIRIDSKGPVLFRQIRVGINRRSSPNRRKGLTDPFRNLMPRRNDENLGRLFYMYKLRTMCIDAEAKSGPVWAKKNDSRVTGIGKILRKTHLDEIPQFYNVLCGDMSIIGPRPERPVFINENISVFNGRFAVKPGITGLAQVRQSYAATLDEIKKKLRYDKLYIKKQSIFIDIAILFKTFGRVVADDAAH